ncbi:TPA: hypothetical protein HA249_00950 [Candidatus Woesearchaeota archaeon]|nr:hypothetical protein [Candidatus Woesearchaeota archaeon]
MSDITSLKQRLPIVLQSADAVFEMGDYTSATMLYFKAWFLALDILLLDKEGKSPKDHTERFMMLKQVFPELYDELNQRYPTYRATYTTTLHQKICTEVRTYVKKLTASIKL